MNNTFTIYMHKNKINQKVYIGQTSQPVEKRWKNGNGYQRHPSFYSAIKKYGWDNFEHIILKEGLTQEEANKLEKYYIDVYNAQDPKSGYNMLPGGSDVAGINNPMYGKHHTEEAKQKISYTASHCSQKTKQKMSESAKKRVVRDGAPFQGKHLSEEAKEKLRHVDKSYTQTDEYRKKMSLAKAGSKNGQAKRIKAIHIKTQEVLHFDCKKDALKFLKLSRSSSKFLNKAILDRASYHDYYWEEE